VPLESRSLGVPNRNGCGSRHKDCEHAFKFFSIEGKVTRHSDDPVSQVAAELARLGGGVSKRVVEAAMAKMGYVLPWEETKTVLAMVCQQMDLARPATDGATEK
jgi:hypothetical protein